MPEARILVVENEGIVALDIKHRLENLGYRVVGQASSGEAAIALAAAAQPDLALMDIKLKGEMDGVQAADEIRSRFHIPVIYLTAFADDQTLLRARVTDAFGYILKPFEERELLINIEIALYKHQMEQALRERETHYRLSQERLAEAQRLAHLGDYEVDVETGEATWSEEAMRLAGVDPVGGQLSLQAYLDRIHPEDAAFVAETGNRAIETGAGFDIEYRLVVGGEIKTIHSLGRVVMDETGRPARLFGTIMDVTNRKLAEAALHERTAELARSKAFIAALSQVAERVETTPDANRVMETLGAELDRLGLMVALARREPDSDDLVVQYVSLSPEVLAEVERATGLRVFGVRLPRRSRLKWQGDAVNQPRFHPRLAGFLEWLVPGLGREGIERSLDLARVGRDTPLVYLPLRLREWVLGALCVWGPDLRQADLPALSIFSNQLAATIEKARLFEVLRRRAEEMDTLREAATIVTSALDLDQVLDRILTQLQRVIPYDRAAVFLQEKIGLQITAGRGFDDPEAFHGTVFPADDPLLQAAGTANPLILADAQADPRFQGWGETGATRGWMGIPLLVRGEGIGYLTLDSRQPNAYGSEKAELAQAFANQAAIAIHNARLFHQVQQLAITDPLTELYNRRHFFDLATLEFERCRRYGHPLSIVMWDTDHFKNVNDTYGHLAGDQVLQVMAARCRQNLREVDVLGRYGGEEFVALLPETGLPRARQAAERLRLAISRAPLVVDGRAIRITVSLGVASLDDATTSLESLLNHADQAMLAAKSSGRDRLEVWKK